MLTTIRPLLLLDGPCGLILCFHDTKQAFKSADVAVYMKGDLAMQNEILESRWVEIADMIHTKWARFTKKEIESLRGNLDDLTDLIQRVYGYARGHAEHECHQFKLALRPILIPTRNHTSKY